MDSRRNHEKRGLTMNIYQKLIEVRKGEIK